jgi:putative cyclase
VLMDFIAAIADQRIDVVDLTAPLSDRTPIIQLPPPFANTRRFELTEISNYDARGPAWYWNDISTGEHVGTHFDAPIHWVTGREGLDVSQVPARHLIAPAVVIDKESRVRSKPRLPPRGLRHRSLATRARLAAPGQLAPVPDGMGREGRQPAEISQRRRHRAAHAWHLCRVRSLARR